MLDFDAHAQLADATSELMRTCAIVTAQTMSASACRSLTLWSDMLRVPARPPVGRWSRSETVINPFDTFWRFSPTAWMPRDNPWSPVDWMQNATLALGWNPYASAWTHSPFASWSSAWTPTYWPGWNIQPGPFAAPMAAASQAALQLASQSAYASYRSSSGHAVAQIITSPMSTPVVTGLTTTAVFTQMQTMLGVWRAALGA